MASSEPLKRPRYEWYQTDGYVTITFMVKGIQKETLEVRCNADNVSTCAMWLKTGRCLVLPFAGWISRNWLAEWHLSDRDSLAAQSQRKLWKQSHEYQGQWKLFTVRPLSLTFLHLRVRLQVEVKLQKIDGTRWECLERKDHDTSKYKIFHCWRFPSNGEWSVLGNWIYCPKFSEIFRVSSMELTIILIFHRKQDCLLLVQWFIGLCQSVFKSGVARFSSREGPARSVGAIHRQF